MEARTISFFRVLSLTSSSFSLKLFKDNGAESKMVDALQNQLIGMWYDKIFRRSASVLKTMVDKSSG